MIKGITEDEHGVLDYIYVPLVMAAPKILGFDDDKTAVALTSSFAATALAYTLFTDAKWGAVKVIPYKTHAVLDLSSGVLAAAVPLVYKIKQKNARNTFYMMALTGLVVGVLSLIGATRK